MKLSLELSLIDPKINLRVGKNTSKEMYEYATLLTKKGLGFPQYCNDDVVVPGLIKLGYDPNAADALAANFEGYTEIRNVLKNCPKMGNNDDYVDDIAEDWMNVFADNMNNKPNGFGGIWRAGTGSANEYIRSAKECMATADGRKAEDAYSSSFSPSLDVKTDGLLSVIASFSKHDMKNIINGGPLTIEVHDTVLRNDIGIKKIAMLVKYFIDNGGHQLQINSVNRDVLLDAQKHPEKYPNLIVRVWGWSGYFNEPDVKYQNHIIRRCEFSSL